MGTLKVTIKSDDVFGLSEVRFPRFANWLMLELVGEAPPPLNWLYTHWTLLDCPLEFPDPEFPDPEFFV